MTSSLPLSRRQALLGAVLLIVALALGGRLLGGRSEASTVVEPAAAVVSTAAVERAQVVVHVTGAVRQPGLYALDDGSRVADAVARAGGPTAKADLAAVNLAAPLVDGTQVLVPRRGAGARAAGAAGAAAGPLRLNTATVEQLDALPGIGPVTAERIVEYREQNGPFRSVDDLDAVAGIGPSRLDQLRDLVAP
ncbi:MAG: ComEA family DNA-binding protein [Gaiellaceae bacterium]